MDGAWAPPRAGTSEVLAAFGVSVVLVVGVFAVVAALGLELSGALADARSAVAVAALAIGLLTIDAFVPVPSTVVMVGLGARFGPVAGTAVAIVGVTAGALAAYAAGRAARFRAPTAQTPAHGFLAVAAARGVPVLGEAAAFTAGAVNMRVSPFALASAIGAVPLAIVSTSIGAGLVSGAMASVAVVASLAGLATAAVLLVRPRLARARHTRVGRRDPVAHALAATRPHSPPDADPPATDQEPSR